MTRIKDCSTRTDPSPVRPTESFTVFVEATLVNNAFRCHCFSATVDVAGTPVGELTTTVQAGGSINAKTVTVEVPLNAPNDNPILPDGESDAPVGLSVISDEGGCSGCAETVTAAQVVTQQVGDVLAGTPTLTTESEGEGGVARTRQNGAAALPGTRR